MSGDTSITSCPISPWRQRQICPCCRKQSESPRLLGCLHSVCSPCLEKAEDILRQLETEVRRSHMVSRTNRKDKSASGPVSPFVCQSLRPLGQFLCPQCNSCHLISRLGVTVLPFTPHQENQFSDPPNLNPDTKRRLEGETFGLEKVLNQAIREIEQRIKDIESELKKLKGFKESRSREVKNLKLKVGTFYNEYLNKVETHKKELEEKLGMHQVKNNNSILKQELQLGQCKSDLVQLSSHANHLLNMTDKPAAVRLLVPVVSRLQSVTDQLIQCRLQQTTKSRMDFVSLKKEVPGYLTTWSISPAMSKVVIDRPVVEQVVTRLDLNLVDENEVELDFNKEPDIRVSLTLESEDVEIVLENFRRDHGERWGLVFIPHKAGLAQLSVSVGGIQFRNSPYIIQVQRASSYHTNGSSAGCDKSFTF